MNLLLNLTLLLRGTRGEPAGLKNRSNTIARSRILFYVENCEQPSVLFADRK